MNAKILVLALCSLSLALLTSADPAAQQEGQVESSSQQLSWPIFSLYSSDYNTHGNLGQLQQQLQYQQLQHQQLQRQQLQHQQFQHQQLQHQQLQHQRLQHYLISPPSVPVAYYLQAHHPTVLQTFYTSIAQPASNSIGDQDKSTAEATTLKPKAKTTGKPKTQPKTQPKDIEPTTSRPLVSNSQPEAGKLRATNNVGDLRLDAPLLAGVQQINSNYIIEDIIPVPGRLVYRTMNFEAIPQQRKEQLTTLQAIRKNGKPAMSATQAEAQKIRVVQQKAANDKLKVEATGKTATMGNIPQIPFGTYFLPYQQQQQTRGKTQTAALILEPHSKAIVGNGGTAISTPISKAYLRKGVPTNVYFNPESVAIAGVGGKAHAQADLELDLYE